MAPTLRTRSMTCPPPEETEETPFSWGPPKARPKNVAIKSGGKFYESFRLNREKYRIGDFVLLEPEENAEPYVARLEELCDANDRVKDIEYQAKVTWYARHDEAKKRRPESNFKQNEVVLLSGKQAPGLDIDLMSIRGHCNVLEKPEEESSCSSEDEDGRPQFFCRYELNGRAMKPLKKSEAEAAPTPSIELYGHDMSDIKQPIVKLVDIKDLSPEKPAKTRLKIKIMGRGTDKENFAVSSSPLKTPSKRPLKPLPNTVEKLAKNLNEVSLKSPRTPSRMTRGTPNKAVCTPKSSRIERTTTTTTRSGRTVRNLFSATQPEKSRVDADELSDGDLVDDDDDNVSTETDDDSSTEISEDDCSGDDEPRKPIRGSKKSGGRQSAKKSIPNQKSVMTPSMPSRRRKTQQPQTDLEKALSKLHVCAVPDRLPCREDQFAEIFDFVEAKLVDQVGSCMYISGVPGTGKTATVREVIRTLQDARDTGDVPDFKFIEINGMKLSEPNQAYVQILRQLNGRKATADSAADILTGIFKSKRKSSDTMTVLLVDELDLLWTRKQQVLYNIFDWPTHPNSRLVVVAIANTMDLPERMVMNKVASRMGLSRMTFQPYTFQELQEIVKARLSGLELMDPDAVQFISRKVAALSGDARRALDVCRRAVELSENGGDVQASPSKRAKKYAVTMVHVNMAVKEMFTSSKIVAMQALSFHEKLALRAIVAEFRRTGVEECVFEKVNSQYMTLARLEGVAPLKTSLLSRVLARMASSRLLILSDPRSDFQLKISLNATADDVNFALREQNDSD